MQACRSRSNDRKQRRTALKSTTTQIDFDTPEITPVMKIY